MRQWITFKCLIMQTRSERHLYKARDKVKVKVSDKDIKSHHRKDHRESMTLNRVRIAQ